MSEPNPSEWVSLREYIEKVMELNATALMTRTADLDRRLEELNNLRAQVITDRGQFVLRDTYQAKHDELAQRIANNNEQVVAKLESITDDIIRQVNDLKRRFAILTGIGLVMVPLAGVIGGAIVKAF